MWLHVNVVGRVFFGYGAVALKDLSLLPCCPLVGKAFTGFLDP